MPGTSRSNQSNRDKINRVSENHPDQASLSGPELWQEFARDFRAQEVKSALKGKAWSNLVKAAKQVTGVEAPPLTLLKGTRALLAEMTPKLVDALDDQKAWPELIAFVVRATQEGHEYFVQVAQLTSEMLRAVHRDSPNQGAEKKLLGIMSTYDGHPKYLSLFMDIVSNGESRNPFKVAQSARFCPPAPNDKPTLRQLRNPGTSTIGAGGQVLEDFVALVHPKDDEIRFVAGYQASLKIKEAFDSENFNPSTRERRRVERDRVTNEYLRDLSFDELVATPESADGSRVLIRSLKVYQALQQHIAELRGEITSTDFNTSAANFHLAMSQANTYAGGTMMTWLRENQNNQELPPEIRDAAKIVCNPLFNISEKERKVNLRAVIAYYLRNIATISSSSVEPIISDAYIYRDLQRDDKDRLVSLGVSPDVVINERLGRIEERYGTIERLLDKNSKIELHYSDVAYITAQLAIAMQLRRAMNREMLTKYAPSIANAIGLARKFFQDKAEKDGVTSYRWKDTAIQGSVPNSIAEEHIEAAKVGVRLRGSQRDKAPCLDREDLRTLLNLLRLETLAPSDENKIQSTCISRFADLIVRSVAIERRIADFYSPLGAGIPVKVGGYTKAEIEKQVKLKSQALPKLLTERDYRPREEFNIAHFGMSLDELVAKVSTIIAERHLKHDRRFLEFPKVTREALAGLFLDERELLALREAVRSYVPATEFADQIEKVKRLEKSGFVGIMLDAPISLKNPVFPNYRGEYLRDSELQSIKALAAFQDLIEGEKLPLEETAQVLRQLREWSRRQVVVAAFGSRDGAKKVNVSIGGQLSKTVWVTSNAENVSCSLIKPAAYATEIGSVFDYKQVQAALQSLEQQYVRVGSLPKSFIDRLEEIKKSKRIERVDGSGFCYIYHTEMDIVSEMLSPKGKDLWISKEARESIEHVATPVPSLKDGVIIPRAIELKEGEPIIAFQHAQKGASLWSKEVTLSLVLWMAEKFSKAEVRELAGEIYKLRRTNAANMREQFARWVGKRYPHLIAPV